MNTAALLRRAATERRELGYITESTFNALRDSGLTAAAIERDVTTLTEAHRG